MAFFGCYSFQLVFVDCFWLFVFFSQGVLSKGAGGFCALQRGSVKGHVGLKGLSIFESQHQWGFRW